MTTLRDRIGRLQARLQPGSGSHCRRGSVCSIRVTA